MIGAVIYDMKEALKQGRDHLQAANDFHSAWATASQNGAIIKILAMCRELLNNTRANEKIRSRPQSHFGCRTGGEGSIVKFIKKEFLSKTIHNLEQFNINKSNMSL